MKTEIKGLTKEELCTQIDVPCKSSDEMLKESIERARAAGVDESLILHNVDEIDQFFTK
jgi:hypothetical protein